MCLRKGPGVKQGSGNFEEAHRGPPTRRPVRRRHMGQSSVRLCASWGTRDGGVGWSWHCLRTAESHTDTWAIVVKAPVGDAQAIPRNYNAHSSVLGDVKGQRGLSLVGDGGSDSGSDNHSDTAGKAWFLCFFGVGGKSFRRCGAERQPESATAQRGRRTLPRFLNTTRTRTEFKSTESSDVPPKLVVSYSIV